MDSKLVDVWATAAGHPFLPTVGKNTQLPLAFILLLLGLFMFSIFALSMLSSNCQLACSLG